MIKSLAELFRSNKAIFEFAMNSSMIMKIGTDSPQAGGVTIELNAEEFTNDILARSARNLVCMTNKGIDRHIQRGWSFDFSVVGANSREEMIEKIKTSDNMASSADLYLFKIDNGVCHLVDANSFKTSTSSRGGKIYLHNDADGSIYRGLVDGSDPHIGQITMVNFDPETEICNGYYFNGNLSKITNLFSASEDQKDNGDVVYHGKKLIEKQDMTAATGKDRQLLTLINRETKKKKQNSEDDLKSTSWTRGIQLDRRFLEVLADRGIIERLFTIKVNYSRLEEEDFSKRYPQTKGGI